MSLSEIAPSDCVTSCSILLEMSFLVQEKLAKSIGSYYYCNCMSVIILKKYGLAVPYEKIAQQTDSLVESRGRSLSSYGLVAAQSKILITDILTGVLISLIDHP